jgi:competence protein ComEC
LGKEAAVVLGGSRFIEVKAMRYPLPIVAVLYVCGLVIGHYSSLGLLWLFAFSFATAGLALACGGLRPYLVLLLALMLGWTNLTISTTPLSPRDLRLLMGDRVEYVTLRGRLCETPLPKSHERGGRVYWRSMAEMDVQSVRLDGEWRSAAGRISISTTGVVYGYSGCAIEVSGVMQPPKGPTAPGQFDYGTYLRHQGIYYQLRCESGEDWRAIDGPGARRGSAPLQDRFRGWARQTLARGLPEDESVGLLWAMVLGWRTALTQEVAETFVQSGTLHLFAISGLHIALIAGVMVTLLRVLQVPRRACGLIVVPLLWFYTAAIGWQASAMRATIMMSLIVGGWALERPVHLLNSLAAAGLIILAWDPRQLFQAGFQLSFVVVLGIGLLVPKFEKARQRLLHPDPLLPPELRPWWKRWLDLPLRLLTASLATSVAAWLGSLPLIAFYFHIFTPGGLLANLMIVPLGGLALMSSLGSLACGAWCLFLTELFNHSAWFWMTAMVQMSHWFASLPGTYFYVRPPSLAEFVLYYLWLGSLLSGVFFLPRWRLWVVMATSGLTLVYGGHWLYARDRTCITVLPIRGGAVFVDAPGRARDLLVDCGSEATAQSVVKPFLRSQGVNHLAGLVLTHGDVHNVGGAFIIERNFRVQKTLTSAVRFRSPAYRGIIANLEKAPERWRQIHRGEEVCGWKVLHPAQGDRFSRADDSAIVLTGSFCGKRVLLLSNLGRLGQRRILEHGDDLGSDILIAGLPDQDEALCESLIAAVQPRLIVIACAEFPATARPSRQLQERLARWEVPVLYTSQSGAVRIDLDKRGWSYKPR